MNSSVYDQTLNSTRYPMYNMLEVAARNVDKCLISDNSAPSLTELMNVNNQTGPTASGLTDNDYPNLSGLSSALSNMTQIKTHNKVPLPPEIMEHLSHFQYHCMMGLFPEIHRAWLTLDSDIYVWTYEDSSDVAYYDGINDTILSVGLVHPKPGVFHAFIKYLLVLTTSTDIVVLGVTFTPGSNTPIEEIQLVPEPVFVIPTDGSTITTISGTNSGRLFLGSKEGYIYEIVYQAESGWFGKRCKKVNRSDFPLSFLIPSFINATLTEEDSILQFSVDNSRNMLYTLTAKGTIESYDMGQKGDSFTRNSKLIQSRLVTRAMHAVKTLDSQNFRPIVSISAVETSDSLYIHLVAVSQTGVRFYLSGYRTFGMEEQNHRPGELDLVHVRLPPGYSANVTVRPRSVHMASYRDRNLVLISSVNEKDILWCLSSDLFPFSSNLMEVYNLINLDGPVLAMSEVKQSKHYFRDAIPAPPLVVRQHFEAPRKYVVLTPHGVHILLKLRPVDVLRQILMDSHGQDTDAIKIFFSIQKEDQACATTLILASLDNAQNTDVSEWATRAFFMFGGEPKLPPPLGAPNLNQTPFVSPRFSPNVISTPVNSHYQSHHLSFSSPSAMMPQQSNLPSSYDYNSPFFFSSKHNGLYLYLSRILRPIWNLHCVQKMVTVDGKQTFFTNTITSDECVWIMSHLNAVHHFLVTNTQLSACTTSSNNQLQHSTTFNRANYTIHDAQLEERQSLDALKNLINHCLQVIGLWKILCEHQFHVLVGVLSENYQNMLQNTTFKELFLYGQELCSILIVTLINSYLGDNASVDSISAKLREVCPNLYKSEDAAYSKANEILKAARNVDNLNERDELLTSALQLCKSIAPNINLQEICRQFSALQYYEAVTDLCIICANKVDPDKVAEHYYNKKLQSAEEGSLFYAKRMEIYKEVLNMLDAIHTKAFASKPMLTFTESTAGLSVQTIPKQVEDNILLYKVLNDILRYEDELLQIAVYEWMISRKLYNDLIKIEEPSLERFLLRESEKKMDDFLYMDLLWKYYESNSNHSAAAKVLNNLASQTGNTLTLKDRLAYLARSVMCMRSDKVGYTPFYGVFLRELEDKIEIGKVQEEILDAICNVRDRHPNAEEAIVALNSGLYDITQLYEDFADPFELWECKLAIIECAGYNDSNVVETIWFNIIQNEVTQSTGAGSDKLGKILLKIKSLARRYKNSSSAFPLEYIIRELELLSSKLRADALLVPKCLLSINIPMEDLINIYSKLVAVSLTDRYWQTEENEFHYSEAVIALINGFISTHDHYNNADKRVIISRWEDLIAMLLSHLYSKPDAEVLTNTLRSIKVRLSQI